MGKYEKEASEVNIHNSLLDDAIDNYEYIGSLIRLLSNIDDNEVICIDGDWGTGKTFLVKQLVYLIKHYEEEFIQQQIKIVEPEKEELIKLCKNNLVFYYNAWQNDDHNDVLESIIYNILNEFPKYKDIVTNDFDGEELLKEVLNLLTKIAASKLLGIDYGADKIDKIKTFNDLAREINTYEERKELFKKLIDKILLDKRMILVIDELDRCNPSFATKVLEVIKHFYNLNNITIIVVSNNKELQNTIKQQYGVNFDAYTYLNKFFDYTITIDNNRSAKYAKKFLGFRETTYLSHNVFYAMIEKYNFSLRDCNRYRVLYDTSIKYIEEQGRVNYNFTQKERWCLYSIILPIIYAFKIKDLEAYDQCLHGKTEKLKDALRYVNEIFIKEGHARWLSDFVEIKDKEKEISDDDVIEEIVKLFIRVFDSENLDKIFFKAIKLTL